VLHQEGTSARALARAIYGDFVDDAAGNRFLPIMTWSRQKTEELVKEATLCLK
jgi:hypothetical protein